MWKWMGLFLRKNNLLRCWSWLFLLNWIGALTSLLVKLPPRKLGPWFILWRFFLLRLFCISISLLYGHALNTVVMSVLDVDTSWWCSSRCYLELLDKPQKRVCSTVSPSLAACLESLAHCQNVASLSLLCRFYFGR